MFGDRPVNSITRAAIAKYLGGLVSSGGSASSVNRYLASLRSLLGRSRTAASRATRDGDQAAQRSAKPREGQFLSLESLRALREACGEPYGDLVTFLGLSGGPMSLRPLLRRGA